LIPEGITRCVKLQKLKLNNNFLLLIPDGLYLLPDLKEMDLTNNPELVMPPKPTDRKQLAFYNIDFSLSHKVSVIDRLFLLAI
jgi:Leucine-rich repeat (LRR) protein